MPIKNSPARRALQFYHRPDQTHAIVMPSRKILVSLGRYGDICTILPYAYALNQSGVRPIIFASHKYASILDGVSYVEKLEFPGDYDDVPGAIAWLKKHRPRDQIVLCQTYRNPVDSRRLCGTYEEENWRVMGALAQFGQHPLVFDKRSPEREIQTWLNIRDGRGLPVILVATKGNSAPFAPGRDLFESIRTIFGRTHQVVDLDSIPVERVYDLLGAYDRATCLVAVDSLPLHLAHAHHIPLIALIGDDPWVHSVTPPTAVRSIRYDEAKASFDSVLDGITDVIAAERSHRFVVHAWDSHGQTERHLRARATWEKAYGDESIIEVSGTEWGEDSREVGDARALPKLKAILEQALMNATTPEDVIVFTNSDVGLAEGSFERFKQQAVIWGAFTVRRVEIGVKVHPGREIFGFTAKWLTDHLDEFPDVFIGAPGYDIVIAALIRKHRGIVSTKANMVWDFAPCELPAGLCTHEPHESQWAGPGRDGQPANLHNLRVCREWIDNNCPTLKHF